MLDRFKQHQKSEEERAKFQEMKVQHNKEKLERFNKRSELKEKIDKEIQILSTNELKKYWFKFKQLEAKDTLDNLIGGLMNVADLAVLANMNAVTEKLFAHTNLKCTCGESLVPDATYGDTPKESKKNPFPRPEPKLITNEFVCLNCGKKYKLVSK